MPALSLCLLCDRREDVTSLSRMRLCSSLVYDLLAMVTWGTRITLQALLETTIEATQALSSTRRCSRSRLIVFCQTRRPRGRDISPRLTRALHTRSCLQHNSQGLPNPVHRHRSTPSGSSDAGNKYRKLQPAPVPAHRAWPNKPELKTIPYDHKETGLAAALPSSGPTQIRGWNVNQPRKRGKADKNERGELGQDQDAR
ncbi:hypothetical protein NW754_014058 [Fusarium falciforme]|nr:hypothetical protein NW754_014058 [Fusarium falciforme]